VGAGLTFATADWSQGVFGLLYGSIYDLVWGIFGSIALGALLGIFLDAWSTRTRESGEVMILGIGVVLVAVGGARWLQLSPLFVTLALGATMVNASRRSDQFVEALKVADPPIYAAFFVLAGAELRPELLRTIGVVGAAYILLRVTGKLGGTSVSSRYTDLDPRVRRYVGLCLLSSSSLAIGLTIQVRSQFPPLAEAITAVVLAAVIVFEILGPLMAKFALLRAGEIQTEPNLLDPVP
jgi:Kef-type K+ transport system membrane component KefB